MDDPSLRLQLAQRFLGQGLLAGGLLGIPAGLHLCLARPVAAVAEAPDPGCQGEGKAKQSESAPVLEQQDDHGTTIQSSASMSVWLASQPMTICPSAARMMM